MAYCDVADLYGSAAALDRWDRFYDLLTRQGGFSRKVVLEGMSRGGLPVYNWAARHPRRVACIYAECAGDGHQQLAMAGGAGSGSEADVQPCCRRMALSRRPRPRSGGITPLMQPAA